MNRTLYESHRDFACASPETVQREASAKTSQIGSLLEVGRGAEGDYFSQHCETHYLDHARAEGCFGCGQAGDLKVFALPAFLNTLCDSLASSTELDRLTFSGSFSARR